MWIVEDLENAIDIVELVWRYTKLKKAWTNFKSICPFPWHNEKTPSFVVSPSKQLAYCFWCHKWGSAVKFIMDIENVSFKEAVDILGWITWIDTWNATKNFKDLRNVYTLMNEISKYYEQRLDSYPEYKKYLFDRGLSIDEIKKFRFWFSDSWVELYKFLKDKGYDDNLIKSSQVFQDFNTKKDKFINRIIFPIQNIRWDIVAFAWRVINENQNPKYLNSPASDIYDKSQTLYGLYQAKSEIINKDFIIITEWYLDVIALHRAWFTNAVCVSWTALTDKHIPIIKRLTKKIYLCFDNDEAWKKATNASIELLKNKEIEVKVVDMYDFWNDPDEIIKSWQDFWEIVKNALTPIWFYLKRMSSRYDLNSIDDRKVLLWELLDILRNYDDIIEKDFYLKEISNKLDIWIEVLYEQFNKTRQKRPSKPKNKENILTSEDIAIWMIFYDKSFKEIFKEHINFLDYSWKNLQSILSDTFDIDDFDLDTKNKYLWISLKIEERNEEVPSWFLEQEAIKLAQKIDKDSHKKIAEVFEKKIKESPDDIELLTKYSNFLKKANENGLK